MIVLTLIFGFLLVVTVVLLNLGASAPLDSVLFFIQVRNVKSSAIQICIMNRSSGIIILGL